MALVFEKYKIDSTQFATSNTYYTSNVDEYEEIFEEVEKRLNDIKKSYQTELDSIIQEAGKSKEGKRALKKLHNPRE